MGKWKSTAGPRQTKAVNRALSDLTQEINTYVEITGVHGDPEKERRCVLWCPLGGGVTNETVNNDLRRIGEQWDWTITRENHKAVISDLEAATAEAQANRPEVDNRITAEEDAERTQAVAVCNKEEESRQEAVDAITRRVEALAPAWAKAVIYAEYDEDDSDLMSDYHNHKTTKSVVIGWRKSSKEDFRALRRAAATYSPTAHLGPGKDHVTIVATWDHDSKDEASKAKAYVQGVREPYYQGSLIPNMHPEEQFSSRADAEAWIQENPAPAGILWKIEVRSVEHRENWSMGAGNYLKDGHRDSTGWCVKSRSFPLGDWSPFYAFTTIELTGQEASTTQSERMSGNRAVDVDPAGVTLTENEEKDGLELRFPDKPSDEVRADLKANGWRWSRFAKCWYRRRTPAAREYAQKYLTEGELAAV